LREINAARMELVHFATMNTNRKFAIESAREPVPRMVPLPSYPARHLAEMAERVGVDTKPAPRSAASSASSPAAWPTGVSLLAQMVDACQRCDADEACGDWLARAPKKIAMPPAFCPNADALKKAAKS
jgi:hypothetical protein